MTTLYFCHYPLFQSSDGQQGCDKSLTYCVCSSWQGCPLHWRPPMTAIIPQDNLAWVSPTNHQVGMEASKADWHHRGLWKKGRRVHGETLGEGLFPSEEKTFYHINSIHPGKHKAIVKCIVNRKFCTQTQTYPWEGANSYSLKPEI